MKTETKTDNELIAEFLGWTFIPESANGLVQEHYEKGHDWMDVGHMKYDTSWDWIMPVVEKIRKMNHDPREMFMGTTLDRAMHFDAILSITISAPISLVHSYIVEFIKWYNSQKK